MVKKSISESIPSETIISASNKPALDNKDKSKTTSPFPSPVDVNVVGTDSSFTVALKVKSASLLSISENVTEKLGLGLKIKWFLSRSNFESKDIVGKSFTGLIVIVTVLFLVTLFSTAVTEYEN